MSGKQHSKRARVPRNAPRGGPRISQGHEGLHDLGKRFMWRCHYCHRTVHCASCLGETPGGLSATRDHYVPKSRGGRNGGPNVVLACFDCNGAKADAVPDDTRGQRVRRASLLTEGEKT